MSDDSSAQIRLEIPMRFRPTAIAPPPSPTSTLIAGVKRKRTSMLDAMRGRQFSVLGKGGHGTVALAYDSQRKCLVAVKQTGVCECDCDESACNACVSFQRELECLTKLNCMDNDDRQYTVVFHGAIGLNTFAMAYYPLGTLHELVRRTKQRLPLASIESAVDQMLKGIAFVHLHNVMHRDVKPDNYLVLSAEPLCVLLGDFSSASLDTTCGEHEQCVVRCGGMTSQITTCTSRAPEMWHGLAYDESIDYWGIGQTFYFMLMQRYMIQFPREQCADQHASVLESLALIAKTMGLFPRFLLNERFASSSWGARYTALFLDADAVQVEEDPPRAYEQGIPPSCVDRLRILLSYRPTDRKNK